LSGLSTGNEEKGKRERKEIIGHISFAISHLSFRKISQTNTDQKLKREAAILALGMRSAFIGICG